MRIENSLQALSHFWPFAHEPGSFLLCSQGNSLKERSFWGKSPKKILEFFPHHALLTEGRKKRIIKEDALTLLDRFLIQNKIWHTPSTKQMAMGYFGYEFSRHTLTPPKIRQPMWKKTEDETWPDAWIAIYDEFASFDHLSQEIFLSPKAQKNWSPTQGPTRGPTAGRGTNLGVKSNFTPSQYVHAVEKVLDYIRQGDLYQANIAQRFQISPLPQAQAIEIFSELLFQYPVPYAAFLNLDSSRTILSLSPERFVRVEKNKILSEPIKGTIKREKDLKKDKKNRHSLLSSPKNLAELTMIIDLERNDLGKICLPGSVGVSELAQLQSFSSVHHLVGKIEGELSPNSTPGKILKACFPGGSITGAPKLRAMEIIAELETVARNVYTGIIGYIGPGKRLDFNIAIRTLMMDEEKLSLHAGAGIVAESNPKKEYEETMDKVRPLLETFLESPPSFPWPTKPRPSLATSARHRPS